MDPFLAILMSLASGYGQWSKPFNDGDDVWAKNPYIQIPKERQVVSHEKNVDETCSRIFGPYTNNQKYGGCVQYGSDDDGLMSTSFVPSRYSSVYEHEEKHAGGWVHPWPGFPNPFQ